MDSAVHLTNFQSYFMVFFFFTTAPPRSSWTWKSYPAGMRLPKHGMSPCWSLCQALIFRSPAPWLWQTKSSWLDTLGSTVCLYSRCKLSAMPTGMIFCKAWAQLNSPRWQLHVPEDSHAWHMEEACQAERNFNFLHDFKEMALRRLEYEESLLSATLPHNWWHATLLHTW